ncbi:CopG family ribbon-helix-helix protein [Pseudomonas meliae]|uniref:PutA RHH domain-containing protein n=1 Tax=Pseudomonas meliae TaxID=86176 RepID=A0A0N8S315_9PSED|nr:ribbon-helix-helix protein, CopG family [Pseudomonas meliae]KPX86327.1 hypothetical protein ALO64_200055 [Pseudomonas meliae]
MKAAKNQPMAVKLDLGMRDRIQQLAKSQQRTPHWMMREAIKQYVEREEKRQAFQQEAIHAWNEYKATGMHLTLEEVETWLAQLEEGKDVEPPACHN